MSATSNRVGAASLTIANLVVPAAALVTAPLLARGLTVDGRGDLAVATATFQLFIALFTFGIPEAVNYGVARLPHGRVGTLSRALLISTTLGVGASVAIFVSADIIAGGQQPMVLLIRSTALFAAPAVVASTVRGYALGTRRWILYLIDSVANPVVRLTAVTILFFTGTLNPLNAAIVIALSVSIGAIVYVALFVRRRRAPQEDAPPSAEQASLWTYGARVWFGSLSGVLLTLLDQVLMARLSTSFEIGLYAVAVTVSQVVLFFNSAVRSVIFTAESEAPRLDILARTTRQTTIVTIGICAAVAISAPTLIPLIFGEEYAAAVPLVLILLLSTVLGNPGSVPGMGLMARGRPELRSFSLLAACAVNIVLIFALVPTWGAAGAAWATVAATFVAGTMNIVFMKTVFGVPMRMFYVPRRGDLAFLTRLLPSRPGRPTQGE